MNKITLLVGTALIFLLPAALSAQKTDSMMNVYAEQYPQEKVYVQFDKNIYNPGDTIWFKAYLFSGIDPSLLSKNFFTEIWDADGSLIERHTGPISESTSIGNFVLPSGFNSSRVHFRAYTAWMLNFDTAFLYNKDIRILIPSKDSVQSPAPADVYFQFFPEGGDVVAGLENNIAFKANDAYGKPVKVKGFLKDAAGKQILEFQSEHDGMGKFIITPEKTDKFTAFWKDEKGADHQTDFPEIKPDGVVLRVMNGNKKVFFSVARSSEKEASYDKLTVIAHMNQQLVYKAIVNLKDNFMSGGSIPVEQLPSGILQITIFDSHDLPKAERVIFINNHDYSMNADLEIGLQNLAKRGKNVIEINVPDSLRSNLSMSVTDFESDGMLANDDNIVSRLLLTGDIKGFVNKPYYYFSNESDSLAKQLDLVLLTHGWRRFKWEQLAMGKLPVIKYPSQDYLAIRAEVLGFDPNRISRSETMNLILKSKDSSVRMYDVPRFGTSKFGLAGLIFYDTATAFYQFNVDRKLASEAAIIFNNGLFNGYKKIKLPGLLNSGWSPLDPAILKRNSFVASENLRLQPMRDKKVQTLQSVTVTGRTRTPAQKLDDLYATGMFSGGDAYTFDVGNDQSSVAYMDILTYLQGKVAGLQINNSGTNTSLSWRGSTPGIFLNEMQTDVSQIKTVPVSDIAYIKVFRPGSGLGFGGGSGGSIVVYTKKGESRVDPNIKGLDQFKLVGYTVVRQFFSPNYSRIADMSTIPDIRTTLYWNPYILTDSSSPRVRVEFYNNDISNHLRVVLEGISSNGKLAHIEKIIQ